ncbi:MAG: hypothetical protein CM15mP68_5390 [Pseudomonadota bacterium]|nr:MAG: hypothetical protein CM15mP68_5390 [Pseudomonadota bacterium]
MFADAGFETLSTTTYLAASPPFIEAVNQHQTIARTRNREPEGVIEQLQDWANLLSQQLLASDPICSQRLAKLAGQSVEVECIQPSSHATQTLPTKASKYVRARR